MTYRCAKALDALLLEINKMAPSRLTNSDGWIGDAAHISRQSDHNPWVRLGSTGIVTARDFTHDPRHSADMHLISERIRTRKDPRVKYVIFDKRIFRSYDKPGIPAWDWAEYYGSNKHDKHLHISVKESREFYDDTRKWNVGPAALQSRILANGAEGKDVEFLQRWLGNLTVDGEFGDKTENAVRAYQKMRGIRVDGIVGVETWNHILGKVN